LAFRLLVKEPLMVILPSDHRLAALKSISLKDLMGETFVTVSETAPVLRVVIDNYLKRSGLNIKPRHEGDNIAAGISLIASTRPSFSRTGSLNTSFASRFEHNREHDQMKCCSLLSTSLFLC
jgi:DNA-binding transcriptional LysR family regulator